VKKLPSPRDRRESLFDADTVALIPVRPALRRTWHAFALAALHLPILCLTVTVIAVGLALSLGLLPLFLLGVPVFGLTVLAARALGAMERSRALDILGLDIEGPIWPPETTRRWWWSGALRDLQLGQTWRLLLYLGLVFPIAGTALCLLTLAPPSFGIGAVIGAWTVGPGAGELETWLWTVGGLVALLVTPAIAQACAALWAWLATTHLSRSETAELTERVETLTVSREALVQAAETERARIERDLHDGAQQRLVSLTMNLGIARSRMQRDPESAAEHVAAAHEDAKAALGELRDLARGIHPVILSDRGLQAALSAVAARAPIPVEVEVRVDPRPTPTVEAVAYFVVTEALTNVARHAGATRAWVRADRRGDVLHLEIEDDGRGGADPAKGTGLAGLRNRVAGAEGTLTIASPDGGPTRLIVELPCGS
jgi:signal transduction histidine kinase